MHTSNLKIGGSLVSLATLALSDLMEVERPIETVLHTRLFNVLLDSGTFTADEHLFRLFSADTVEAFLRTKQSQK